MAQAEGFNHITVTVPDEEDEVIRVGVPAGGEAAPQRSAKGSAQSEGARTPQRQARPKAREEYRESTLEDLKPTPMPFVQKAVIAAALVCIIGAIVYYIAFLG